MECCAHTHTCCYRLTYVDFINSNYLSIILYGFILMSCRPRPVRCTSRINAGARNYLVFNVDNYIIYVISYCVRDRNKTLYLSYDDLWFVFKNDYRTRIMLCILFTTAARVLCDRWLRLQMPYRDVGTCVLLYMYVIYYIISLNIMLWPPGEKCEISRPEVCINL